MDKYLFLNPLKTARPMVRWWWPGLDVREDELIRELDEMDRLGIGGAEIQPFAIGLPADLAKTDPGRAARTHRFMQPYHYQMMQRVVEAAGKRGITIDITQNSAWPTGGTHITVADSHKSLFFGQMTVRGPRAWQGKPPALRTFRMYTFFDRVIPVLMKGLKLIEFIPEDKKLLRVVAGKCLGRPGEFGSWKAKASTQLDLDSMVDLTNRVDAGGVLRWDVPDGTWQIFAVYEGSAGSQALMDARAEPGKRALMVDHFDRAAETRHLEAFLGRAREHFGGEFGKTFRAFFTDSFELISPMHWKTGFLDEFKRRRGYDIAPFLPAMYIPLKDVGYWTYGNEVGRPNFDFPGDAGPRMRYDFQRTISELFIEEFIQPMADWAHANGLQSRVQGYGMLADPLAMLGYSDIPETEQLYGGGALNFLKLAGAAGTLYGRPIVTSETLVWQGRAYMTTPLKWRVGIDRLFESGINQVIYHGFPYHHPGSPAPGYHPFASPHAAMMTFSSDMSENDPLLAAAAPALNAYAARAQYILQNSRTSTRVGIFYQLFDYPNGNYIREELVQGVLDAQDAQMPKANRIAEMIMPSNPAVTGDRQWIQESAGLAADLVAAGHYPIYFNEDRLLRARIEGKAVVMGEATFEALILYREPHLTAEAAAKLREIAAAGIPVLFAGGRPDHDPGYFDHAARDLAVRDAVAGIPGPDCADAAAVLAALQVAGVQPEVIYDVAQPSVGFIHKIDRADGSEFFFLRNRTREERVVDVTLRGHAPGASHVPGTSAVFLDLWTGRVSRLPGEPSENGIHLSLCFAPYESKMIWLTDASAAQEAPLAPAPVMAADLEPVSTVDGFSFAAEQRLMNGASRRIEMPLPGLKDWREILELATLGDPGEYTAAFTLASLDPARRYFLQLDRVCDRADVVLNGRSLDPLLLPPWRCEITGLLVAGANTLKITVTPTLRNRLVGYANAGSKDYRQYKGQPLMPAGLIGPVMVCAVAVR
jgi:hypothetical protein